METQVINTEKMEALKSLAQTNVKVGEAKGILLKLKAEESDYLNEREKKTLEKVNEIMLESESILKQAFSNYEEIKKFGSDVAEVAAFLAEAYKDFQDLQESFNQYNEEWQKSINATEARIKEMQDTLKADQDQLAADQKWVRGEEKKIAEDKRKIRSDRETLVRGIARLKENIV